MVNRHPADIRTERLVLRAMTLDVLHATLADSSPASRPDAQEFVMSAEAMQLFQTSVRQLGALRAEPGCAEGSVRAVVDPAIRCVVGYAGFIGMGRTPAMPDEPEGNVEIDCAIAPGFRRRGFGREAVTALLSWARDRHRVSRAVTTLPTEASSSIAFARALGFEPLDQADNHANRTLQLMLGGTTLRALRTQPPRRIIPYVTEF